MFGGHGIAVSYTHLDVYKRQRPFRMMDIAEQLKMEYEPFAAKKQLELSVSNKDRKSVV